MNETKNRPTLKIPKNFVHIAVFCALQVLACFWWLVYFNAYGSPGDFPAPPQTLEDLYPLLWRDHLLSMVSQPPQSTPF